MATVALPVTVADSYRWSAAEAKREARNFYYAFRLLSPEKHRAICSVYTFFRISDDLADDTGRTVDQKREALAAWRRDTRSALAGQLPPHALWPGFADAVQRYSIPHHVFEDMIDGMVSDLEPRRIATFDELYRYCYQVASVVGISVIHIFGFTDPRAPLLAEKCGLAFQLTNILRDVQEDLDRGRVYLPQADLDRFGVTQMADSPAFRDLLRLEGQRARGYFDESRPLLDMIHPASRASLRALIEIYSTLLHRIEAADYDVLTQRIRLSGAEKTWVMIRSLLATWAGRRD
ncbi:MAG: phytoene/squalene synthase family protein [Acidobacteria bacterium]|nr:phytoene/squalene synthase family protein [Acidobacteriota bacterium]